MQQQPYGQMQQQPYGQMQPQQPYGMQQQQQPTGQLKCGRCDVVNVLPSSEPGRPTSPLFTHHQIGSGGWASSNWPNAGTNCQAAAGSLL